MILGAGASKTVFRNFGSPPSELAENPTFRQLRNCSKWRWTIMSCKPCLLSMANGLM